MRLNWQHKLLSDRHVLCRLFPPQVNVYVLGKTFLVLARELCINAPAIGTDLNLTTLFFFHYIYIVLSKTQKNSIYIDSLTKQQLFTFAKLEIVNV